MSPASSSRPPASSCLSSDGLRVQQPAQLETAAPHRAADVARAEIHRTLRTSAQTVLGNIGTALDGISSGQYGRCLESGDGLSPSGSARFRWPPGGGACQRAQDMRVHLTPEPSQKP